jgi:hypothetical protein
LFAQPGLTRFGQLALTRQRLIELNLSALLTLVEAHPKPKEKDGDGNRRKQNSRTSHGKILFRLIYAFHLCIFSANTPFF